MDSQTVLDFKILSSISRSLLLITEGDKIFKLLPSTDCFAKKIAVAIV